MKRRWYNHFEHKDMFVFVDESHNKNHCSGWDCKGNKFVNEFHFIDNRYKEVTNPVDIELLDLEFDRS